MTIYYMKYVIKKSLLSTYTYAIIDIREKELFEDIRSLICNCIRFENCDKILVCTKNSEDKFVVEKYPFEDEDSEDKDDVFNVIIRYIASRYSYQNINFNITYGAKRKTVKILSSAEFLDVENGKKSKIITTVGPIESGQVKFGRFSVENGNKQDE
uniref:hypothetical protein n=1 Tax=Acetivibrio cellulolyticus TaxID=35830 RepID=UPI0001E2D1A8|nr:hypothetical protein [Acetivibrio cellulolyticus]